MGIANIINVTGSAGGGEIIRELINSSDGQGLHFDGAAGRIDVASPPDLGTKFSFEFVLKADSFGSSNLYFVDFGNGGRFIFGTHSSTSYNWAIFDNTSWNSFGVKVSDDLEVHHLVVTVDGTAAVLYDNGNQVGTTTISAGHGIDSCSDLFIGSAYSSAVNLFNGSLYRCRFYNKALTQAEVDSAYQKADVPFIDQYGSETNLVAGYNFTSGYAAYGSGGITDSNTYTTGGAGSGIQKSLLTVGKKYRVTVAGSSSSGDFQLQAYGTWTVLATGFGTHEFTATTASIALTATASSTVDITTFSLTAIGAVTDYDLAFANPTQSLMVQDRAGVADGTSSASGVSQTQKIVQLNATAISVSNATARTPSDGEIVADEFSIAEFKTSTNVLETNVSGQTGARLRAAVSDVGTPTFSFNDDTDTGMYRAAANSLGFTTGGAARMTIDSAGLVSITKNADGALGAELRLVNDPGSSTAAGTEARLTFAPHHSGTETASIRGIAENTGAKTKLSFYTHSGSALAERATIDGDGNVLVSGGGYIKIGPSDSTAVLKLYRNDATISSDAIGDIDFGGADADNEAAARIRAKADGTWTATSSPTKLEFSTCPSGSETLATRMTITEAGLVSIGGTSTSAQLNIRSSVSGNYLYMDDGSGVLFHISANGSTSGVIQTQGTGFSSWKPMEFRGSEFQFKPSNTETLKVTSTGITLSRGFATLGEFGDLTIASGAVTATSSTHNIDTEGGGATDYLDTINGGSTGSIITLMAASGSRTVVVEDGTNLKLAGDCTLDNAEDTITLIKSGSAWHEVSRSNNGA